MSTATETRTRTFSCRRSPTLEIVLDPADALTDWKGNRIDSKERTTLNFVGFLSTVTELPDGKAAVNGKRQPMDYDELLGRVEAHPKIGSLFVEEHPPEELKPTLDEIRDLVDGATAAELGEMLTSEQNTHNRPDAIALIGQAAVTAAQNEAKISGQPVPPPDEQNDPAVVPEDESPADEPPEPQQGDDEQPPDSDESASGDDSGEPG